MSEGTQRRLAAIVAADVVGYSRLMGVDETGTLAALNAHRSELIDPLVAKHGGRIVKTMGDGLLLEFPSVVAAVECVIAAQTGIAERNADIAADEAIQFRVGVHLGDVIVEGDDIFGDGVNIAARLEGLSEANAIALSDDAYRQVRDRLDADWEDGGEHEVKNITRPVHVWRWSAQEKQSVHSTEATSESLALPDKPSIAVLPFVNMSGDPEQEYFADGLAEDLITTLSKVSTLSVIGRNSTFAYKGHAVDARQIGRELGVNFVLEGSTRKSGSRLRITAQLVDARLGDHAWAERYDRQVEDIFDLQDNITREIVTALRIELTDGENASMWNRGTENIEAWRFVIEAADIAFRFTAADTLKTRGLMEQATKLDSKYAAAWALLGFTHFSQARTTTGEDGETVICKAEACAAKAAEIDEAHPLTVGLNTVVRMLRHQFDTSIEVARKGLQDNPGSAEVRAFVGFALSLSGHATEALQFMEDAMRLNPHFPVWYHASIARAHDALGDRDAVYDTLDRVLKQQPDNFPCRLHSASLLGRDGRLVEAREAIREVLRLVPGFNLGQVDRWLLTPMPDYLSKFKGGLHAAGLPKSS